jgi:hypothetical protein
MSQTSRRTRHRTGPVAAAALLALSAVLALPAAASTSTFGDRTSFLVATTSANATGAFPVASGPYGVLTIGSVTFQAPRWFVVDFSSLLPGKEIAISDGAGDVGGVVNDGIDAQFAAPVYAAGFDFLEPTAPGVAVDGCNVATCVDSQFEVRLFSGATHVATLPWLPPDDSASFFGVWSSVAFDRMLIRETVGTDDNEFYGHFYTGTTAPVPEPAPWALLGAGLLTAARWRRRQGSVSAA